MKTLKPIRLGFLKNRV